MKFLGWLLLLLALFAVACVLWIPAHLVPALGLGITGDAEAKKKLADAAKVFDDAVKAAKPVKPAA